MTMKANLLLGLYPIYHPRIESEIQMVWIGDTSMLVIKPKLEVEFFPK